jgi:uncharacterized membrane protein YbhN (UPF0104 family)
MPKMLKSLLKFICFLGIGLLLIWLVTKDLTAKEEEDIKAAFRHANYWLLIPTFILGIASHWFRAVRWRLLMKPMGFQPSTFNTFFAVMVGYLANLAIPRLGEVTRCGILARYEKIPADKLIGTMIAERAVDLLCLILLMIFTVLVQINIVGAFFADYIWHPLQNKLANASLTQWAVVVVILLAGILLLIFLLRRFARTKAAITIRALAKGVLEGILSIGKMQQKGAFLFYTATIWLLYFSQIYIGFSCLQETSDLGIKASMSVLAFGSIGMIVTQGGIGAYQLLVQQTLVLYGIHATIGYAFGWIIWLAQTLLVVVLGFGSLIALPLYNKTSSQNTPPVP